MGLQIHSSCCSEKGRKDGAAAKWGVKGYIAAANQRKWDSSCKSAESNVHGSCCPKMQGRVEQLQRCGVKDAWQLLLESVGEGRAAVRM